MSVTWGPPEQGCRIGVPFRAQDLHGDFSDMQASVAGGARLFNSYMMTFLKGLQVDKYIGQVSNNNEHGMQPWELGPDGAHWVKFRDDATAYTEADIETRIPVLQFEPRRILYRSATAMHVYCMDPNDAARDGRYMRFRKLRVVPDPPRSGHVGRLGETFQPPLEFTVGFITPNPDDEAYKNEERVIRSLSAPVLDSMEKLCAAVHNLEDNNHMFVYEADDGVLLEHYGAHCTTLQAFQLAFAAFDDLYYLYKQTGLLPIDINVDSLVFSHKTRGAEGQFHIMHDGAPYGSLLFRGFSELYREGTDGRNAVAARRVRSPRQSPADMLTKDLSDVDAGVVGHVNASQTAFALGLLVVNLLNIGAFNAEPNGEWAYPRSRRAFVREYTTSILNKLKRGGSRSLDADKRLLNFLFGVKKRKLLSYEDRRSRRGVFTMDTIHQAFLQYFAAQGLVHSDPPYGAGEMRLPAPRGADHRGVGYSTGPGGVDEDDSDSDADSDSEPDSDSDPPGAGTAGGDGAHEGDGAGVGEDAGASQRSGSAGAAARSQRPAADGAADDALGSPAAAPSPARVPAPAHLLQGHDRVEPSERQAARAAVHPHWPSPPSPSPVQSRDDARPPVASDAHGDSGAGRRGDSSGLPRLGRPSPLHLVLDPTADEPMAELVDLHAMAPFRSGAADSETVDEHGAAVHLAADMLGGAGGTLVSHPPGSQPRGATPQVVPPLPQTRPPDSFLAMFRGGYEHEADAQTALLHARCSCQCECGCIRTHTPRDADDWAVVSRREALVHGAERPFWATTLSRNTARKQFFTVCAPCSQNFADGSYHWCNGT